MCNPKTSVEKEETSANCLSEGFSVPNKNISQERFKSDAIFDYIKESKILDFTYSLYKEANNFTFNNFLTKADFEYNFILFYEQKIKNLGFNIQSIQKVGYKNGNILLDFGGEIGVQKIAFSDFQKELAFGDAKTDVKKVEQKIQILHLAMESIYFQNKIIGSEIDDTDIVNIPKILKLRKKIPGMEKFGDMSEKELETLLKPYKGLHLGELNAQLNIEQKRLVLYYDIIGQSKKSLKLLEQELLYIGSIGRVKKKGRRIIFEKGVSELGETEKLAQNPKLKQSLTKLVLQHLHKKNDKWFAKPEETIVNIGEIIAWRHQLQQSIKSSRKNFNYSMSPNYEYYKYLRIYSRYFKDFETYSDMELRALLKEFRGKDLQTVQQIKNSSLLQTQKIADTVSPETDKTEIKSETKQAPTDQILEKVEQIVKRKSVKELIEYIRIVNNKISDSGKIPDDTKNRNKMIIKKLTADTFKKMKRENSRVRDFINFARVITGRFLTDERGEILYDVRSVLIQGRNLTPDVRTESIPENIVEVKTEFKQTDLARKVLLYVMYQRGGVDQIQKSKDTDGKTQKVKVQDEIYTEKKVHTNNNARNFSQINPGIEITEEKITSIQVILDKSLSVFEEIGLDRGQMLEKMGLNELLCKKDISVLSFQELLLLGTFYRISKNIKKQLSTLKGKTPQEVEQILSQANNEALEQTFSALNNSFEKNFDASFWDGNWNGKNGDEFSELSPENAEVFDLYGEINGRGYFELADDNWIAQNLLTKEMGVVLAVGVLTAYLVLPGVIMATGCSMATLVAGAKIGATTSIASQIMSDKGYDTFEEEIVGRLTQFGIDVGSSAVFTAVSAGIITKYMGTNFASTLARESGKSTENGVVNFSQKTISRLTDIEKEITKELNRNLGALGKLTRTPKGLWSESAESARTTLETLRLVGFSGKLEPEMIQYLAKFSAVSKGIGQLTDIGIGLGDGINASILEQYIDYKVIHQIFAENHLDPDKESFLENRYGKKVQEQIQQQETQITKQAEEQAQKLELESQQVSEVLDEVYKNNPVILKGWNNFSPQAKKDLALMLVMNKSRKILMTMNAKERESLIDYVGIIFKANEGIE